MRQARPTPATADRSGRTTAARPADRRDPGQVSATFEKQYSLLETGRTPSHRRCSASPGTVVRHGRRAAEAERPSGSASTATRTSSRSSSSCSARRRSTPSWSGRSCTASLTFLAENLGGEHPLVKLVLAGKNPGGAGRRTGRRHEAGRPGRAQEARRGRQEGDRREQRPDDRAGAGGRRRGPRAPQAVRGRGRGTGTAGVRRDRQAALRGARQVASPRTRRSRCGWRSASCKGYEVGGEKLPFHTTFGEAFEKHAAARRQGAVRPAEALARRQGQARPRDAVQLRLDGGHDRRQLAAARC